MKRTLLAAIAIQLTMVPSISMAQSIPVVPMAEVIGQPIEVTTNGYQNTLYFAADGTLRIVTPKQKTVSGRWAMQGQNFCINTGGTPECWPYQPFHAQVAQTLTSNCASQSTWLAQSINSDARRFAGERGR